MKQREEGDAAVAQAHMRSACIFSETHKSICCHASHQQQKIEIFVC